MELFVTLTVVLLATSASASPVFTVPLTRLQSTERHLRGSLEADRARAAFFELQSASPSGPITVPATNLNYIKYTTRVGIGNPPTYYNLIVDTGSSNTFCGAGTPYVRTSTSIPTGKHVNVTYVKGNFSGNEYLDQVTLAPNLVIINQSIGDALSSAGFDGVDGILGVGPVGLTQKSLSPDRNATIPTVIDNLIAQGLIKNKILCPSDGALTYGGADPSLFEGEMTYVSLTKTRPSAFFWGLNVTSCTYGAHTIIPTSTAGIVDAGTTLIYLASDFFTTYLEAIPGAKYNSSIGLIEIPPSSVPSMQPLNFKIGDRVFPMDVAAQLLPADQNTAVGLGDRKRYSLISKFQGKSGKGLDFIIGQKFMERYYVVFDADAQSIGIAQTCNTFTTHRG